MGQSAGATEDSEPEIAGMHAHAVAADTGKRSKDAGRHEQGMCSRMLSSRVKSPSTRAIDCVVRSAGLDRPDTAARR